MRNLIDPLANHLETRSFKEVVDIALLNLVKYPLILKHWRAETTINNPLSLRLK